MCENLLNSLGDGMLIIFGGLPGTGKTTLARELSRQLRAVYLRIDAIEQGIRASGCLQGDMNDAGYRAAYLLAAENLALGLSVVADSVNPLTITREAWLNVAQKTGSPTVEIEIICSVKCEHKHRVESRCADITDFALPSWQDVLQHEYEPWSKKHLIIDTAHKNVATCIREITAQLLRS